MKFSERRQQAVACATWLSCESINTSDFMRNQQNNNQRRNRGRNNNNRGGQQNFRSNGGGMNDARARGNAHQLLEKFKNMARDAAQSGDRVLAEYYMQHADHYYRVVSEFRARFEENRPRDQQGNGDNDYDGDDNGNEEMEGVDSVDLRGPQNFAASVAAQTVGADSAPAIMPQTDMSSEAGQEAGDHAPSVASADDSASQNDGDDRQRRRGRSRRGPRRPAAEDAAEPAES
jgi:hypothetical protein